MEIFFRHLSTWDLRGSLFKASFPLEGCRGRKPYARGKLKSRMVVTGQKRMQSIGWTSSKELNTSLLVCLCISLWFDLHIYLRFELHHTIIEIYIYRSTFLSALRYVYVWDKICILICIYICISGQRKIKGFVVLQKKNVLDFNDFYAGVIDNFSELFGSRISF